MKIKNETGVFVRLPSADEHSNVVRLEGSPSAVKEVKEELTRMLERKVSCSCCLLCQLPYCRAWPGAITSSLVGRVRL